MARKPSLAAIVAANEREPALLDVNMKSAIENARKSSK